MTAVSVVIYEDGDPIEGIEADSEDLASALGELFYAYRWLDDNVEHLATQLIDGYSGRGHEPTTVILDDDRKVVLRR